MNLGTKAERCHNSSCSANQRPESKSDPWWSKKAHRYWHIHAWFERWQTSEQGLCCKRGYGINFNTIYSKHAPPWWAPRNGWES